MSMSSAAVSKVKNAINIVWSYWETRKHHVVDLGFNAALRPCISIWNVFIHKLYVCVGVCVYEVSGYRLALLCAVCTSELLLCNVCQSGPWDKPGSVTAYCQAWKKSNFVLWKKKKKSFILLQKFQLHMEEHVSTLIFFSIWSAFFLWILFFFFYKFSVRGNPHTFKTFQHKMSVWLSSAFGFVDTVPAQRSEVQITFSLCSIGCVDKGGESQHR